jgi:hypothetical protein
MKRHVQIFSAAVVLLTACGGSSNTAPDGAGGSSGGSSHAETGQAGGSTGATSTASSASPDAGGNLDTKKAKLTSGDPCTNDDQCGGGAGLQGFCMQDWPGGGYCTSSACTASVSCPSIASCQDYQGTQRCLLMCTLPSDCRSGYTCTNRNVCIPAN